MNKCPKCRKELKIDGSQLLKFSPKNGKPRTLHANCIRHAQKSSNPVIGTYMGIDAGCKDGTYAVIQLTTPSQGKNGFYYDLMYPKSGKLPIEYKYLQKPLKVPHVSPYVVPSFEEWKAIHLADLTPKHLYDPYGDYVKYHNNKSFEEERSGQFYNSNDSLKAMAALDNIPVPKLEMLDIHKLIFGSKAQRREDARKIYMNALTKYKKASRRYRELLTNDDS